MTERYGDGKLDLPMGRAAYDRGIIGKPPEWQFYAASPGPPGELPF